MLKKTLPAILLFSLLLYCRSDGGEIIGAAEKAKRNSRPHQKMVIPEEIKKGASRSDAARKTVDLVESREFRSRVDSYSKRLSKEVFGSSDEMLFDFYSGHVDERKKLPGLAADERVYLFVSASMPIETLRTYAREIDRLADPNIIMVMRGFVNGAGTFAPSMKFISGVLLEDPDCTDSAHCRSFRAAVEIDPNLYRRFRPESVPAVVYVRGVHPADPERSEGDAGNVPVTDSWWMLYGDSSLSYSLSRINERASSQGLAAVVRLLAGR